MTLMLSRVFIFYFFKVSISVIQVPIYCIKCEKKKKTTLVLQDYIKAKLWKIKFNFFLNVHIKHLNLECLIMKIKLLPWPVLTN